MIDLEAILGDDEIYVKRIFYIVLSLTDVRKMYQRFPNILPVVKIERLAS